MSFKEDVLSFSWLRHSKDNCPDRVFPLELYLFSEPLSLFGLSMRGDESLTSFPPYSIPDFMTLTISARAKVRASSNCKERGPDTPSSKSSKGLSYLWFSSWCRIPSQGFIPTSKSQGNAPLFLSPQMSQKMRRRIILVIRSFLAHKPIFPLHAQSCVALSQRTPISLLNFQKPWSKSFSSSYNAKLSDSHSTLHSCTKNIY